MFDLGWSKILILAAVAIVVVGPKELPGLLRTLGQFIAQLRRHAAEFRTQFDDAIRSTELDQIRRDVEAIKTDTTASLRGIERSIQQDVEATKASVESGLATAEAQKSPEQAVATLPARDSAEPIGAPPSEWAPPNDSASTPGPMPLSTIEPAELEPAEFEPANLEPVHLGTAAPVPAKTGA